MPRREQEGRDRPRVRLVGLLPVPIRAFGETVGLGGIQFGVGAAGPFEEGFEVLPIMAGGLEADGGDFCPGDPRGRFQEGFEPLLGVVEGEAVPDDDPVVIDDAAFVLELADVDADVKFSWHVKMLLSSMPHPLYARLSLRTITASMKRHSVRQLINGARKSRAPDHVWNGRAVRFRRKGSAAWFGLYPKRQGNSSARDTEPFYTGL